MSEPKVEEEYSNNPESVGDSEYKYEQNEPILKVDHLSVSYPIYGGWFQRQIGEVKAVRDVSFEIRPGETLGLVGESGCGKTTIAKTILGLVKLKSGHIYFHNKKLDGNLTRKERQKIQMVFQDPDASLNPRMKIVDIIGEPLRNLMGISKNSVIRRKVLELLKLVSMKPEHLDRYPHEFSGGQKQRIVIARALACNPEIIILDEPTSALDVSVQSQILNLLEDLQNQFHLAYLFITHDLSVIHHVGNSVAVMYLGKIVEKGSIEDIFYSPVHPYTRALLSARPALNDEEKMHQIILQGEIPSPSNPPQGCPFHPRCFVEQVPECKEKEPEETIITKTHSVWCHTQKSPEDVKEYVRKDL